MLCKKQSIIIQKFILLFTISFVQQFSIQINLKKLKITIFEIFQIQISRDFFIGGAAIAELRPISERTDASLCLLSSGPLQSFRFGNNMGMYTITVQIANFHLFASASRRCLHKN